MADDSLDNITPRQLLDLIERAINNYELYAWQRLKQIQKSDPDNYLERFYSALSLKHAIESVPSKPVTEQSRSELDGFDW